MRLRLIVLSFLMLFVELALIRWTGSNIVFLSYFSNFVLLGSFLGIGIGFLRADSKWNLFPFSPVALALLVAFVTTFPVTIDRSGSELLFFGGFGRSGLPIWATLPVVFLAVALTMAMIAEGVARTFKEFEPLEAYRLDILGSLGGIVAFSILSFAGAPPVAWGVVVVAVFIWLLLGESKGLRAVLQIAAVVAIAAMLLTESMEPGDAWSPYYKVQVRAVPDGAIWFFVNGIPHQLIQPIEARREREPFYFLPYERRSGADPPEDVLIVGAGTGTDVAIALSEGAGHVDAVEIDPKLQEFGEQLHPDRPYQDERVRAVIDDGRAFLQRSDDRYDLIVFALPDSLTLVSGQSSLRLESYLFTLEAFREARDHLKPGGVFAMYNYYREPWLVDRLAGTLQDAFGTTPCVDSYGREAGGLAVLAASENEAALSCGAEWQPVGPIAEPATDDHPFVYLQNRGIPAFYLTTIGLILLASLAMVRVVAGPIRRMRTYADLFFMGAAFLLLETKNVVQFALLFGTTWFVNALVFAGILLTVLAAVEVARRVKLARP
ncbi:MAG: spermidine synthase, partial [Actinomycetota bacterium]